MCCDFVYVRIWLLLCLALRSFFTEHWREERAADALVVVIQALEDQERRYRHEDYRISVLYLCLEHLVLFCRGLDD
jgi:hypothetical protein